jgi:hypothetical protein
VNHLGDTNKMVRDTPRTDGEELPHALDDHHFVVGSFFARQLERELNAANDRIKRMEEAGDAMALHHNPYTLLNWQEAKEVKL